MNDTPNDNKPPMSVVPQAANEDGAATAAAAVAAVTNAQTCGGCKFSHFAGIGAQHVNCRRYPPSNFPVPGPRGQLAFINQSPSVKRTDWCGEWKPKLSS